MKVAVAGGAGYVGGELLRILLQHPKVTEVITSSRSQAGQSIAAVHPSLAMLTDARFTGLTPAEAARGQDVIFLALEHGASTAVMGDVIDAGAGLVIDMAADFRIHDGRLHEKVYGEHQAPQLVHRFRYGLADVVGSELRDASAIASPGCFATAAQLALYAIADLNLAAAPTIFAVTGSSGAGQSTRPTTHHPFRSGNLFAYQMMTHRHEGEVLEQWRSWRNDSDATARLMTHAGPFVRGIHATLHAHLSDPVSGLADQVRKRFSGRPFVHVLDGAPRLSDVIGSNMAQIGVASSEDGMEVQVMCAIDNLIKGAAGQAVQAMNLSLGFDERAGLVAPGVSPC
jgi:N-acetyl-gamma-glutamyl-phosphate reductase common form